MPKHWDYEDDHDWDDNIDYQAQGYVYWYGKYYPKAEIEALFNKDKANEEESDDDAVVLLALAGFITLVVGGIHGIKKAAPRVKKWWNESISPKFPKKEDANVLPTENAHSDEPTPHKSVSRWKRDIECTREPRWSKDLKQKEN